MFQPHGFGPLAKMGEELAESFANGMAPGDRLYLPDPVYQGGTVDADAADRTGWPSRSRGHGGAPNTSPSAQRSATRWSPKPSRATASSSWARATTRLSDFARELVERLAGTLGLMAVRPHGSSRNRHRLEARRDERELLLRAVPAPI